MSLSVDKRHTQFPFTNTAILWKNSYELNKHVATLSGGKCYLSFSGGKDAVASYLYLREMDCFKIIQPYMFALNYELSFIKQSVEYFEDFFKTTILKLPTPAIYTDWLNGTYLTPEQYRVLRQYRDYIKPKGNDDFDNWLREDTNTKDWFMGVGVKAADGIQRRGSILQSGGLRPKIKKWFPIFDFTDKDVATIIKANGIKLPYDYPVWGRSFDGVQFRFYKDLYTQLPEDAELCKQSFPLCDMLLYRYGLLTSENIILTEKDLDYLKQ